MATAIYKPGQGYWTRMMSAIGFGTLIVMGALWAAGQFANVKIAGREPVLTQALVFLVITAIFTVLGYWLIGLNKRMVDFMIATESEMKKVNWSSKREIIGSTWVVIGLTFFLAVLCFLFDTIFQQIFTWMRVLET
jgi:preprotein translocase SecE subunit